MARTFLFAAAVAAAFVAGPVAAEVPAHVAAAVSDAARPEADQARDAVRKPAEMLVFAEVEPGDIVLEMLPGSGYFTRVLAKAVGEEGKIYAAEPPAASADAPPPPIAGIAGKAGYENVVVVPARVGGLTTGEPVDLIWTAQNYHDFHLARLALDVSAVNRNLYDLLKPGGTLIVIDHTAVDGAPLQVADTLHRIDPAKARSELEAVGFVFAGESQALRNPADPRTGNVFAPDIRGQTDQFVYKFKKPE